MKNEKEIRKTLTETKEALKEYQDSPTESEDESIYLGWVEALEYVLACSPVEEVDPGNVGAVEVTNPQIEDSRSLEILGSSGDSITGIDIRNTNIENHDVYRHSGWFRKQHVRKTWQTIKTFITGNES